VVKGTARVRYLASGHIVALLLGVLAAAWSPWPWTWGAVGLLFGAGAVLAACAARLRARAAALALACAFGGAAWTGVVSIHVLGAQLPVPWEGREFAVRGQVVSLPTVEKRRSRFLLRVDDGEDQSAPLRGRLLQLAWYDDFDATTPGPRVALQAGAHWQMQVRLRAPRGLRNPGGFDAERSALAQRWMAVGKCAVPSRRGPFAQRMAGWPGATGCPGASRPPLAVPARAISRRWRWAIRAAWASRTGGRCAPAASPT